MRKPQTVEALFQFLQWPSGSKPYCICGKDHGITYEVMITGYTPMQ